MNTSVMMERTAEASPRPSARITGLVYLLYFLTAVLGEFFMRGLVVDGDAAATANNILAHEALFRLGLATGLIATACYIAVTALFYGLFKPVNRSLSLLAAFFSLAGCAILAFASLFQLAPLVVLGGSQYLSVFKVEQLRALALLFLELIWSGRQHLPGIFRSLLPPDRLPHLQVGLPASNSGRADGVCRFGLADFSVTAARKLSVPLHSGPRLPRGTIADAMAPREGRERSTMEGAGQRGMKAGVYPRSGATIRRSGTDLIRMHSIQSLALGEKSMSTAVMMKRIAEASPRFKARMAGALYLLILLTAAFTEFLVRGRLNFAGGHHRGLVHDRCDAALL